MTSVLDLWEEKSRNSSVSSDIWDIQEQPKTSVLGNSEVSQTPNATSPNEKKQYEYAGFWLRFVAFFIDMFLFMCFLFVLWIVLESLWLWDILKTIAENENIDRLVTILLGWAYYAFMESSKKQATLWKQAMGIKVTDENGQRVTLARASIRHFAKILSGAALMIGYIMVAFTEKKQGLHDLLAQCLVVRKWTWKAISEISKTEQIEEKLY